MSHVDIARAWRDPAYRAGLTPEQRDAVPPNPIGLVELDDAFLASVSGGHPLDSLTSRCYGCTRWEGCIHSYQEA